MIKCEIKSEDIIVCISLGPLKQFGEPILKVVVFPIYRYTWDLPF